VHKKMSELLTDKERPLLRAQSGEHLSIVAQARTLTVLERLDGSRKGSVLAVLVRVGTDLQGSHPSWRIDPRP